MQYFFAVSWLVSAVVVGGCASDSAPANQGLSAGTGGSNSGGLGSLANADGGATVAGTSGAAGVSAGNGGGRTGISGGAGMSSGGVSGGAGIGSGGSPTSAGENTGGVSGGAGMSSGVSVGGAHSWVLACPPSATRQECCMHYCSCMATNCAATAPTACVETCAAPDNQWNLKCRVEQCFEALNPNHPEDRASHCGHALEKPAKCQGIIP